MNFFQKLWIVAYFDLIEALRSRRAHVIFTIFLIGSLGTSAIFTRTLYEAEKLYEEHFENSGIQFEDELVNMFSQNDFFTKMVTKMVDGDKKLAEELLSFHPLTLFYGWLAMSFVPILVLFTSCDVITVEIATGSCRFSLTRTDRLSWASGKLLGHSGLIMVGLWIGGIMTALVGTIFLKSVEPMPFFIRTLGVSTLAAIYSFPYLGLFMGISLVTRSTNWARFLSLMMLFGLGFSSLILNLFWSFGQSEIALYLLQILPKTHRLNLWHPDTVTRCSGIGVLLVLGLIYFSIGYRIFKNKDA